MNCTELKEAKFTELDQIVGNAEVVYLDNGGCLSHQERDQFFMKVVEYAKKLEKKLELLGQLEYLNDS